MSNIQIYNSYSSAIKLHTVLITEAKFENLLLKNLKLQSNEIGLEINQKLDIWKLIQVSLYRII